MEVIPSESAAVPPLRRRLTVPVLVAGFALLTGVLLALALGSLRAEALRAAQALTQSLALVITEQTARTMQTVDDRLLRVLSEFDGLQARGLLDETATRRVLRANLQGLPFVRALWMLDTEGRIVFDSDEGNIGVVLADREYFQIYQRAPATEFHVGQLVRSRTTGTWLLSATRPWRDAQGRVRGVLVAALEPPYFETVWQGVDLGRDGVIALYHRSGQLLMRSPRDPAQLGTDAAGTPLFTAHLPQAAQGSYTVISAFDGVERLAAFRVLSAYPELVVAVGQSRQRVLAPWRDFAWLSVAGWAVSMGAALALTLLLRRQSRQREAVEVEFRELAQAMPQIVFIADQQGAVQFFNQRWTEVTGLPIDAGLGSRWLDQIHPEDRAVALQGSADLALKQREAQSEVRLRMRDGSYRWQLMRAVPTRHPRHGGFAWYGTATDIHAQKQVQEEVRRLNDTLASQVAQRTGELARQEALFHILAQQAPWPFWTADPAGRITFFSSAWYELAGGEPPQWHGLAWLALAHPDDLPALRESWARSRETGAAYAGTRRIRARDGSFRTTRYRATPVRDTDGQIVLWVGIDTDITDIMANEAALRLANEQLEAFSYSVSHDLQSPVGRIASFADLLRQELSDQASAKARHYLDRIGANARLMAQLIEGLLALARVSRQALERAPVDVSAAATDILRRLQQEEPERGVDWTVQPGLMADVDGRLLGTVLENLIGNAWKFTRGKTDARIEVGGSPQHGEFFVRDNGAGFDMAYADRLFGTFQRLHAESEFPGTGIGLATVARAVLRHGGRVSAVGEPGRGATFTFTLPPAR